MIISVQASETPNQTLEQKIYKLLTINIWDKNEIQP